MLLISTATWAAKMGKPNVHVDLEESEDLEAPASTAAIGTALAVEYLAHTEASRH